MNMEVGEQPGTQPKTGQGRFGAAASACLTIAALYLPQTWILVIDYPWNTYRWNWIVDLGPGLPLFLPFVLLEKNDIFPFHGVYVAMPLLAFGLYQLGRYSRRLFLLASAMALLLSSVSALFARAYFLA